MQSEPALSRRFSWCVVAWGLTAAAAIRLRGPEIDSIECACRRGFASARRGVNRTAPKAASRTNRLDGVTVRSTVDCLIAQCAIESRLILLHHDTDFKRIARVVPALNEKSSLD